MNRPHHSQPSVSHPVPPTAAPSPPPPPTSAPTPPPPHHNKMKKTSRAAFQATAFEADSSTTPTQATRASVLAAAERAIEGAALAYGDPPAAVTFAEDFLEDEGTFFLAMDTVSRGRFLVERQGSTTTTTTTAAAATTSGGDNARQKNRGNGGGGGGKKGAGSKSLSVAGAATPGMRGGARGPGDLSELLKSLSRGGGDGGRGAAVAEGWRQLPWLTEMGGFSLAAFLANR